MGLFDSILEETPTTTMGTSSGSQGSSTGGDDSNFLIIDDSNKISNEIKADTNIFSQISSNDIPDSAISFFNESEAEPSETLTIKDSVIPVNETLITQEEPVLFGDLAIKEDKEEKSDDSIISNEESILFGDLTVDKEENTEIATLPKADPNTILVDAIANLQKLEKGYDDDIDGEMKLVGSKQEQINILKQEIKISTEKAKSKSEEKAKVSKMIELFQSQKI